ncbi:MAG: glycoside hydrolase family 5 protein [Muribaculum sp.]|nr:glycoside hydrolase family 5 protein [Muribaculum sp.]
MKKTINMTIICMFLLFSFSSYGLSRLKVEGSVLKYENGETAVLTGPSLGWHSNWARFYNAGTITAFKDKWHANITRAAIGAHPSGDVIGTYDTDSVTAIKLMCEVIDAAIKENMYIICDWHSHENTIENAINFFSVITDRYGNCPNVLYEIWNEPLDISWQEIKDYAEVLIPVIRKKAPDSVIIVGTPRWDQEIDAAAKSPLDYPNLLYSLHFYAGTHKDWLRSKAEDAISMSLPIIISECGAMDHTGDGPIDYTSWQEWIDFADANNLSVVMWDIADKNETCSMISPSASDNGMEWREDDIKEWGKLARNTIQARNK